MISTLVTLTAQLEAAEKALSKEKDARLAANRFLAEEKAARQIANQHRWAFEEATVALTYDLLSAQASITATMEKLAAKSSALDITVIQEREVELKLQTYEEKRKAQEQLLESTQKALSKREFSSSAMISSAVAHAVAHVKNHMPEFDAEILRKDITIDDAGREALAYSTYDTTQYFVSLYDCSVLAESDDNASPGAL
jgi:hypothetical protein